MKTPEIQWLTQDKTLFELDWLTHLFKDCGTPIKPVVEGIAVNITDSIIICNHAVPYRFVLDELRAEGKKYAIVLLSDENLRDPCEWLHDPNCVRLLRNYLNPMQLKHPKVTVFGLGYKRGFCEEPTKSVRDHVWCFMGTPHGERKQLLDLFKPLKPYIHKECSGFGAADGLETQKYSQLMRDSVFALCPAGQDSMDSFRLYEALEAGCIPITVKYSNQFKIYPSYWHGVFYGESTLPFVLEESWQECFERVKNMSETETKQLQEECKLFWAKWKLIWKQEATNLYNKLCI
jgi:hypothetical protein